MTKEERENEIDGKCDQAGCDDKKRARHRQMFVHEHWDVHPSPDFVGWYATFGPGQDSYGHPANPISGWNTESERQDYFKWIGAGRPAAPPQRGINHAEELAKLRETIGRIGNDFYENTL